MKSICQQQPFVSFCHMLWNICHISCDTYKVLRISGHNSIDIYALSMNSSYIVRYIYDDKRTFCHKQPSVCGLKYFKDSLPHFIWNLKSIDD